MNSPTVTLTLYQIADALDEYIDKNYPLSGYEAGITEILLNGKIIAPKDELTASASFYVLQSDKPRAEIPGRMSLPAYKATAFSELASEVKKRMSLNGMTMREISRISCVNTYALKYNEPVCQVAIAILNFLMKQGFVQIDKITHQATWFRLGKPNEIHT